MRKVWVLGVGVMCAVLAQGKAVSALAQEKDAKDQKSAETPPAPPKEESFVTDHSIKIGGQTIPYKATVANIILKDDKGEPTGNLYYLAYTRTDTKDTTQRPLAFLYNGGPGSSSVWLHMGAFGPRRVVTTDPQSTPPPPYKLQDNANCLLDKADLVFIDPIGTGFSKAAGKAKDKDFWGIDQDMKSLAQFVTAYVSRNNRWNSPKFLIGESYGTFRNAALANYLQNHENLDLNGIVMVSMVLDLGTISFLPGQDLPYVLYVPSYAATAWYHKALKDRPDDLTPFLAEARRFAQGEYAAALIKGSNLTAAEKADVAKKLARFTGLTEDYVSKANLRVNLPQFMQELQRSRGLATGRLDSRFSGLIYDLLSEYAEYDPQDRAVSAAFTAALNSYIREELKVSPDKTYTIGSDDAARNWDWKHEGSGGFGFPGAPNVEGDLIQAMISNPHLHVEVENGIYDLATPFFGAEHTVDHLGLPEKLRGNIRMQYYDAGHMMYVRDADLARLKANVASFIDAASKP